MTQITIPASPANFSVPSTFASQQSFSQKILNFAVTLDPNAGTLQASAFPGGIGGTINISGARARVRIEAARSVRATAVGVIYGLDQSLINSIVSLGIVYNSIAKNGILISAGASSLPLASAANSGNAPPAGFPVVFGGTIFFSYGDYSAMPDVGLRFQANTGLYPAVQSTKATSFQGSTSIVSIMQGFASALGVPLENNGVTGSLSNPYFAGTLMQQIFQAADHAGIGADLVDGGTKLAIWPLGSGRSSLQTTPLISKDTGMIRAPSFMYGGWMTLETIFNPDVTLFGNVQVISETVPQANGLFTVYSMSHVLDTLQPKGEWKSQLLLYPKGYLAPTSPSVSG